MHQARNAQAWDQSWTWNAWEDTTAPRPRTPRQRSSSAKRHGKGRGKEKGQTKTKDKSAGEGHGQPSPFLSAAPNLTAPIPPSPFPAIQLTQPIVAASDVPAGPGADLIAAIRRAYPDSTAMPSEVRDALDRSELVVNKQVTQDLHRATASLGRAQRAVRELEESRERHRQLWYQHLQESLKMWKDQMDGFDTQQEEYHTAIQKAKADMNQAHHNIQTLNARAAGKPPPEPVMEVKPEDQAAPGDPDPEERALRKQLHNLVAQCALKVCGKNTATTAEAPKGLEEIVVDSDEEGRSGNKRFRSTSPSAAKGTATPALGAGTGLNAPVEIKKLGDGK